MDTDFEQQPVSETVVNDEENAEPSKADTTEPQTENNELNSVVESLQKEIESLKQELELKEEQVKSATSQFMRLTADFDNFRRRTSREKEELESQVKKKNH